MSVPLTLKEKSLKLSAVMNSLLFSKESEEVMFMVRKGVAGPLEMRK